MDLHVTGGGTFYQHPLGSDKAPNAIIVAVFPSLAYDTFVTIGVEKLGPPDGQPSNALVLTPGWPGFGPSSLAGNSLGWAVTPSDPQADPFNRDFVYGNGWVLIGRFSTADGTGVEGTMKVFVLSDGVSLLQNEFIHCDCHYEDCTDGNPCNGEETCAGGCQPGSGSPTPDCNSNGTLDSCDIASGMSDDADGNGIPDECVLACLDCAGGDAEVDVVDLLALLGQWGQAGTSCDFSGNGVTALDFLYLLANWGPCP